MLAKGVYDSLAPEMSEERDLEIKSIYWRYCSYKKLQHMKMLSAGMSGVSEDKKQGQMPVMVQMQTIIKERYIGTALSVLLG